MWDFVSSIDGLIDKRIDSILNYHSLKLTSDERYGVYTVTEAAGYVPPMGGPDFSHTFTISLGIFCFLPWVPPKYDIEKDFIVRRRTDLFESASVNSGQRILIAARVNRQAFQALKTGGTNLKPFDLFNFAA